MKKDGNVKIFVFLTELLDETANQLETASWAWWAWWASHLGGGRLSGDRAIVLRIGKTWVFCSMQGLACAAAETTRLLANFVSGAELLQSG